MRDRSTDPVAVIGGSGFVGGAVLSYLTGRGVPVRAITAPRLQWQPSPVQSPPAYDRSTVQALATLLQECRVVVNAAGIADGLSTSSTALFGANALLPSLVARACWLAGVERYIHISSVAVQGRLPFDETVRTAEFSPYSRSKALGERLLLAEPGPGQVIFRSTFVHGPGRPNTRALIRLARSPLSCVAGDGRLPTPHVLIDDAAAAIGYLVLTRESPAPIVLQPPTGMTTGLLLRLLGGREPRHLPMGAARTLASSARCVASLSRHTNAVARRVDMVLFGRHQTPGWLADRIVTAIEPAAWARLATMEDTAAATLPAGRAETRASG
jgi:UDP-glucose 4-epimerase